MHWGEWIAALAFAAASPAASAGEVVEAERAFAAKTAEIGFKQGFLAFAAPDGFIFEAGPVNARASLAAAPDAKPGDPVLAWWPLWAGMARSGDLGFTTGAANIPVRYFTVWQRQADGSLKWIYDGGPPLKERMAEDPQTPVRFLAPASAAAGSAEQALAEIAPLEADLAAIAAQDARAAHLKYLAEDGLAAGPGHAGEPGREAQLAALDMRPAAVQMRPLGATASRAGDLAFTYGESRWSRDEQPRRGHYVRIWQKRREGWKLVSDMLIPAPPQG